MGSHGGRVALEGAHADAGTAWTGVHDAVFTRFVGVLGESCSEW